MLDRITGGPAPSPVTVPHDAMLAGGRSADAGSHTGYFRGGAWQYEKAFDVPQDWATQRVTLEFEGVYRDAMVYVNGGFAGQWAGGYSIFHVAVDPYLEYGRPAVVRVEAQAHADSRWYSGAGIHRPVHLLVGGIVHVTPTGPRVATPQIDAELGVAAVSTDIVNEGIHTRTVEVLLEIRDRDGRVVATEHHPATLLAGDRVTVRQRAYVPDPRLWSPDSPVLYTATVGLADGTGKLDEAEATFGFRTVTVDPVRGLRINGSTVSLRGACVHHDNGILGAAAVPRADERRVERLRAAGFNAIRSAHNPMSVAMLDACDRLGVLVVDELCDVWTAAKTADDYSRRFPEWWERDLDAMVAKDVNHPSVIAYSIGNEILEAGMPHGARWGRRIAERARRLDPDRLVTNALNGALTMIDAVPELLAGTSADAEGSGVNSVLGGLEDLMDGLVARPEVGERLAEAASVLDVVGLNYGDVRYLVDREAFPNRVVMGSETFPSRIDRCWRLVTEHPHVIGDFTWTGWDYLGETGLGRPVYPGDDQGLAAAYPWLTASTGDIDITGVRRPASYYRETVFGRRHTPYLAVQRPDRRGHPVRPRAWTWTDARASWTWDVPVGTPVTVDVYTDAEEVTFVLDGITVRRARVGTDRPFVATADLPYRPGTLDVVAFTGGVVTGRGRLRTAGPPKTLALLVDRQRLRPDPRDLAFVDVLLVDAHGTVHPDSDRMIVVDVDGPATLQGLGTARPSTEESFLARECTTYEGRALVAVRPTGDGEGPVVVTVHADELAPGTATVLVRSSAQAHGIEAVAHR